MSNIIGHNYENEKCLDHFFFLFSYSVWQKYASVYSLLYFMR